MKYEVNVNEGYRCIKVWDERDIVPVVGIGDVHYGAETCDIEAFQEALAAAARLNAYIVLMGDLMENSSKNSVADGWVKQKMSPQQQKEELVAILKPYADMIIGALRGNHEDRSWKDCGIDPMSDICALLGISDRYFTWEFHGIISGGAHGRSYTMYAVHSKSASKTNGLELNMAQRDIGGIVDADICLKAHGHKNAFDTYMVNRILANSNTVQPAERAILLTGHFLDRANSYPAAKPMGGSPKGCRVAYMQMDSKKPRRIWDERIA